MLNRITVQLPVEGLLFWKLTGREAMSESFALTLTVLGMPAGEDAQDANTIYLPIGNPRQIQVALAALWPDLRLQDLRFQRTPRRARWSAR